ncbi:MAG: hypothetical protein Q8S11_01920 [Daejeonella sp.]|uniref:hypothetical protein n=1 Tax=Daejeonella sp. TaxID=2805397 RepID=UPI002732BBE7|nr:hypothetical protein [Daejeonella sp.]MDP3467060.1 hypothetical protein [Daejeonella sp.]
MSELERIIELLERIVRNQQSALNRSACEQSVAGFNLQDWGLPEENLKISLRSLCYYRQKVLVTCTGLGGRSYYYFPDLLKRDIPGESILAKAILFHKFVVYAHRINC